MWPKKNELSSGMGCGVVTVDGKAEFEPCGECIGRVCCGPGIGALAYEVEKAFCGNSGDSEGVKENGCWKIPAEFRTGSELLSMAKVSRLNGICMFCMLPCDPFSSSVWSRE